MVADVLVVVLLLFCSALFASSEVAFFSLTPTQLSYIKDNESKRPNKIILHLLNQPKKLLVTLLIANTLVNIANIILSALFFSQIEEFEKNPALGFAIQIVVVTFLITLFGEVIPKVYAAHNNVKIANTMALPVYVIGKVLTPLTMPLVRSTAFLEKRLKKKSYNVTLDELTHAIEITSDEDSPPEEKRILKGIVSFGNIDVKQIMRPRQDVIAFEIKTPFADVLKKIKEVGYSRIPVFESSMDNIKGVLHIKDLIAHLDKENFNWTQLIRPPYFVPESKKINNLLQEFQQRKIHMAVVVDEFGGTLGIATLEDVLEEIVGELKDEFDDEELSYTKIDENTFVFEAKTLLNDVCRIMEINRDEFDSVGGDIDTLAGMLLELNREIPAKDKVIRFKNMLFTIESADKRRIKRVKVFVNKEEKSEN